MVSAQPRDSLIASVIDHCLAFKDHLEPLHFRQYASDFPKTLLERLADLNIAIREKLEALKSDPDFQSLSNEEAEQHILRYSWLYSQLYVAASIVERSDVPHTVVELVQPIKRLMQLQCGLKDFELLLHPLPVLNYSFYHLGNDLSKVKDQLEIAGSRITFPKRLITVGFPGLEMGRLLIHSIIAHELGHCLYVERKLESKLLRFVKPDEQRLDALVREWAETAPRGQRTLSEYVSEVEIKSVLTRQINRLAKLWVKELTCDAIGYCLFGPAYLFAALDFLTIAYAFDDDLHTHPPNRMRFRLLYEMLDKDTDFLNILVLDPQVKGFLDLWRSVTQSQAPQFTNPITDLTGRAILNIYDRMINTATSAVGDAGPYSASENATELQRLVKRAEALIPPNELIETGGSREVKFQSVLNAGWLVYLTGLKTIQEKFNFEPWECKKKFNENIARAVELNEIQRRWGEVQ
jgi:hypothetical protein